MLGFAATFIFVIIAQMITLNAISFSIFGITSTLCSIGFLIKNGTYLESKIFRLSLIMIPFILIGSLFKIQHYPGALILLSIGFIGILIFYLIHSLTKKNITIIDYGKLAFITFEIIGRYLKINHFPYADILLNDISPIVFFGLVVLIVTKNMRINPNWMEQ